MEYNIGTIEMQMYPNGFPKGFILKREPTVSESMYILQNILGFANEGYKDWYDYEDERECYCNDCQKHLVEFLKGECDWEFLSDSISCYDELGFPMASAFSLAAYLKEKGII